MGWVALVILALFFIWLFYKGYKAYQKNGWDDDFFKNDGAGFGGIGQLVKYLFTLNPLFKLEKLKHIPIKKTY